MKKKLITAGTLLLLLLALLGCHEGEALPFPYLVRICDFSDIYLPGRVAPIEFQYFYDYDASHFPNLPTPVPSLEHPDTGEIYYFAYTDYFRYGAFFHYREPGSSSSIITDSKGNIVGEYVSHAYGEVHAPSPSEEKMIQQAQQLLQSKVDMKNYRFEGIYDHGSSYSVSFRKWIGEYQTVETMRVWYEKDGCMSGYSCEAYGSVPDDVDISAFDMDLIKVKIEERLDHIYAPIKARYRQIEYQEPQIVITIIGKETVALEFNCYVNLVEKETDQIIEDSIAFIVTVPVDEALMT